MMKTFRQFLQQRRARHLPFLDEVYISDDGLQYRCLDEGRKWVNGRFQKNIGIDQPTSGAGQRHAHVYGRKGDEIVVVNVDGTGSHGTEGKLHDKDAEALVLNGFTLRPGRIVEWSVVGEGAATARIAILRARDSENGRDHLNDRRPQGHDGLGHAFCSR
jgi:hypothetical protein